MPLEELTGRNKTQGVKKGLLNAIRYLLYAKEGFTLVEIMIVVLIIGVLAAIVAPYYVRAREEAKAKACIANLKEIEGAKERWAVAMDVGRWDEAEMSDLVPAFLKTEPRCPSGGNYTIDNTDNLPTCDIGTNDSADSWDDHVLYNR